MLKEKFENIKNTLDIICNNFNKVDMLQMYSESVIIPYIESENPEWFDEIDYEHDDNEEFLYTSYTCQCGFVHIIFTLERTDDEENCTFIARNLLSGKIVEITSDDYNQAILDNDKKLIQQWNDLLFDIFD